ncbi:MAG: VOC family protein [Thermomicrobiales bacterium]|nr:VOC family protein [Thermomicrobiales bacterium]
MTATFNHTIIAANDPTVLAEFYRDLLEATKAPSWGPFVNLILGDVMLQFATPPVAFQPQHYAFLLDDEHFDRAYSMITESGREFWADPQQTRPQEINTEHNGRGIYLIDPSGHYLELITRAYL